ncbi:MAG: hypothetical protein NTV24_03870, partial [Candidatus Woesebacteria bacterium]|nr:hypothetical protein [Candidatus Woesebacteria bacterium]
ACFAPVLKAKAKLKVSGNIETSLTGKDFMYSTAPSIDPESTTIISYFQSKSCFRRVGIVFSKKFF